ncbi:patched domain-containing protein 3-like isoform X2 [Paramacrobiotus metropolitanus]|nr:patched domain-containing protein 3-like isoform X2 [Paramacrobiotus metropolitanus]
MIIAISVVGTGSMGFLNFHLESRPEELWTDHSSAAYMAKRTALTFPVSDRIQLTILITAPNILTSDIAKLMQQIDDTIEHFNARGKSWSDLCYRKNQDCQNFSILNILSKSTMEKYSTDYILSVINQPGKRKLTLLPPYFISPEDVLSGISTNNSGHVVAARATRMVYFIQKQEPDKITREKPIEPEEMLRDIIVRIFGQGFGLSGTSVTASITYADGDTMHSAAFVPFDYFPSLIYACIAYLLLIFLATGAYSVTRHGFWLAICGLLSVVLAMAFGFGIASAVGSPFTPIHFILPVLILGMSIFGFLAMEVELRAISDTRPSLSGSEKMGVTMQRSFATLLLCLLSNVLVFAVGIGSRLPAVRSFCVYGVTSAVGIFICQILFLFGCLAAWQRTYENSANAWICCLKKSARSEEKAYSLYAFLKPGFGFLASNLADNIGKGIVLLGIAVLTGVCIYFLFSLRIMFDLGRFETKNEAEVLFPDDSSYFHSIDNTMACVYLSNIPYHQRQSELRTFQSYLKEHAVIRPRSVSSWLDYFDGWKQDEQRSQENTASGFLTLRSDKAAYYQDVFQFVFDRKFQEDVLLIRKSDDQIEIQSARICFRFRAGLSTENYSSAVDNIRNVASDLQLGSALVDCKMLLEVSVQKTVMGEFWVMFGVYFAVLLIISALVIQTIISALVIFISYALIAIQAVGLLASQPEVTMDSLLLIVLFCILAIVCQIVYYTAAKFVQFSAQRKRKARLKATMISSGPACLACGLCAIGIFVPFFASSVEVFRDLLKVAYTSVPVGLVHAFLFVPVALSAATPESLTSYTMRLRRRLRRKPAQLSHDSLHYDGGSGSGAAQPAAVNPEPPNDQVHFVARHNPPVLPNTSSTLTAGSVNSVRLHYKNAELRAVLESLPSVERESVGEGGDAGVRPQNAGSVNDSDDSLAHVEIPSGPEDGEGRR